MSHDVSGTAKRLTRASRAFRMVSPAERRFMPNPSGEPSAVRLRLDNWQEGSEGDPMHKLMLVLAGQVDLEGRSGGWLVLPNHLILVPATRHFNLRTAAGTVVDVVHLDPADSPWRYNGCWVTAASMLAHEMISYALTMDTSREGARQVFRALWHMCFDWFANPRMLFFPAARSPELRAVVEYIRDNLAEATVAAACEAAGMPQRTLHRHCHGELGFGLRSLIREVRIMQAMELLAGRDASIQAVGKAVGFASVSSFSAAFSERLGISPAEYMRTSRTACAAAQFVE